MSAKEKTGTPVTADQFEPSRGVKRKKSQSLPMNEEDDPIMGGNMQANERQNVDITTETFP